MKKMAIAALTGMLLLSPLGQSQDSAEAKVMWGSTELVKGQVGKVTFSSDIKLYKKNKDGSFTVSIGKKGQAYRVYEMIYQNEKTLYNIGGNIFVPQTNIVKFEKAPSDRIQALGVNYTIKTLMEGITYPEFSGLFNKKLERSINHHFLNLANKAETEYWDLKDMEAEDEASGWYLGPYDYSMKSSVSYNQDNRLSVSSTYYMYSGGAHGLGGVETYNYDLLKAKEIQLGDVITNKTQLNKVNTFIKNTMIARNKKGAQFWVEEFESVNLKQDQFYFKEDGIMIIFQEYEYGPYSNGINFFKVPYSVFKH
ncbi:DUF3298 and DUF4163 domain-containing protein [Metabacillus iocasae]|uniref:DUF3298 domain-containing protein n=1 Tax=Priestia iocasae TaxID=2291674 RepID=A0ABS2QRI7_9BACI|nr:DUF3298 and DUF4163 domain-containing protein [Metabacillus iocasae]MBM7702075.1 hypothetical protein [Metabacillus iocasae]